MKQITRNDIYYVTISVSQESRHNVAGSSSSECPSHKAEIEVTALSGADRAGSTSKLIHGAVARIRFLTGCWTEGLDGFWMKAIHGPGSVGVLIVQLPVWPLNSIGAINEKAAEDKHSAVCSRESYLRCGDGASGSCSSLS